MARLPAETPKSSLDRKRDEFRLQLAELVFKGIRPPKIARMIHPNDPAKRKRLRTRIRHMVRYDPQLKEIVIARTQEEFLYAIGPITQRLNQRAQALGKPDAVKLVYEASGFHNPRIKHDHSGSVEIKLTIPRPELPAPEAQVVDADAVTEE